MRKGEITLAPKAVFLTARFTDGYFYGTCPAFINVLAANFFLANNSRKLEINLAQPKYLLTEMGVACRMADRDPGMDEPS